MNIVLCGMPGCGKSTIGRCLAEKYGLELVDTDAIIVERFGVIAEIFEKYGEGYFRDLETAVVQELSKRDGLVVSTGGGLVLREENASALKANGELVYLRASVQTLVERLRADTERPLLQNAQSMEERLKSMLQARAPVYERVADRVVCVDGKTPEEIVEEIGQV